MNYVRMTLAYGFKTRELAELRIISLMEESYLSACENPQVKSYKTKDGHTRYLIESNGMPY